MKKVQFLIFKIQKLKQCKHNKNWSKRLTGRLFANPVIGIPGFLLLWHHWHLLAAEVICTIYRQEERDQDLTDWAQSFTGFHKKSTGKRKKYQWMKTEKEENGNKTYLSLCKSRWKKLRGKNWQSHMCGKDCIFVLTTNVNYIHIYINLSQFIYTPDNSNRMSLVRGGRRVSLLGSSGPCPLPWLVSGFCTGLNSMVYEWIKLDVWSRGGTVFAFFIVVSQQQLIHFSNSKFPFSKESVHAVNVSHQFWVPKGEINHISLSCSSCQYLY